MAIGGMGSCPIYDFGMQDGHYFLVMPVLEDFGASVFDTTISRVATPAFAGDANLDGLFDSSDLIGMFRAGEYEDAVPANSTWSEGDFNNDHEFTSADLVLALRTGRYLSSEARGASLIHPVPEPGTLTLLIPALLVCMGRRRSGREVSAASLGSWMRR
jgi:hypothetical protein